MIGQQRKANQQQEQVCQDHPLVLDVQDKAHHSFAGAERRQEHLVERDDGGAGERDLQRVVVEEGHTGQHQPKQYELNRHGTDAGA